MRLDHDWIALDVPANVDLAEDTYLHSAFAFLHCRSERAPAVRIGRHTAIYDGTMFDLGPTGSVEIGEYGKRLRLALHLERSNRRRRLRLHQLRGLPL